MAYNESNTQTGDVQNCWIDPYSPYGGWYPSQWYPTIQYVPITIHEPIDYEKLAELVAEKLAKKIDRGG